MTRLALGDDCFEAICSYYATNHVPREEHLSLLRNFCRMLRPSGLLLVCMGAADVPSEVQDDFEGKPMYWRHCDAATNVQMLDNACFDVTSARLVGDETWEPRGAHPTLSSSWLTFVSQLLDSVGCAPFPEIFKKRITGSALSQRHP